MLTHIHIQNFTIVKSLSLDFENGLHVLTGETGAGKSIWIDAIDIGLGARVDSSVIYPGENSCDISLCFDLKNLPFAKTWLAEQDLSVTDECIIRRVIYRDKPSRTTVNGAPLPQQLIRELANLLICVHGQHQHQQLLKSHHQRECVDHFADHEKWLTEIESDFSQWQSLQQELQTIRDHAKNKTSDVTLWQYQLEELKNLQLKENEYEHLFSRYQQLHHAKQFIDTLSETLVCIDHDEHHAAAYFIDRAIQSLKNIKQKDSAIENIASLLETASIHLNEAGDALREYCHKTDLQLDHLDDIEKRLTLLQDIARKHHVSPNQLNDIEKSLTQKIETIEKSDEFIQSLEKKQADVISHYQKIAAVLTASRQKAAHTLSQAVAQAMQKLGMPGGQFNIILEKMESGIHARGNEKIIFQISANPGQPLQTLSNVISGGELSRLSLILQVFTAKKKNTPTLIFDEVDAGIGGKTAEAVGQLLRQLGQQTQVLCVTHLAQVAANGQHHFLAEKKTDGKTTTTTITLLNAKQREHEMARMLSGSKITEKSLQHARELLTM